MHTCVLIMVLGSLAPPAQQPLATCWNACSSDADCSAGCGVCWAKVCDPCHAAPQCGTCPDGCSCSFGFCVKAAAPTPAPGPTPPPTPAPPSPPATLTWVGKSFTNGWTDANNWDPPKVPTLEDDCIVGGSFSASANSYGTGVPQAKSLVVKDSANVSIANGQLTVAGKVTVQDKAVLAISQGYASVLTAATVDVQSSQGLSWMAGNIDADVTVGTLLTVGDGTQPENSNGFKHHGKLVNNGKISVAGPAVNFGEVENKAAISILTGSEVGRGRWAGVRFGSCTNVGTVTVGRGWVYFGKDTAAASATGRILISGDAGLTGAGYANVEVAADCNACSLGCQISTPNPSHAYNVTAASGAKLLVGSTVTDLNAQGATVQSPGLHTGATVSGTWKVGSVNWFNEDLTNNGTIVADSISISGLVYTFQGGVVNTGTMQIADAIWPFGNAQVKINKLSVGPNAGYSVSGGQVSWSSFVYTGLLIITCKSGVCPPSCSSSPCPAFAPSGPGSYSINTQQ
eukprot:Hpha_TRINITY_DN15295_c3_g6::TRINITY_DN15295_c3_g6_i1::g.68444::m.68444